MKMRQDQIDEQFDQLELPFVQVDINDITKLAIEMMVRAAEMADKFNADGAPDGDRLTTHQQINHELFEVEKALNLLPKNNANRKKIAVCRRKMLTMPFSSSEGVYALKNEFFGVRSYTPDEPPTFQGKPLRELQQQSLL